MTNKIRATLLILCMMFVITFVSPVAIFANSLDDISNGSSSSSTSNTTDSNSSSSGAVSDYLNGYTPITDENMAKASTLASPFANFLGTVAGGIVIVVQAAIIVVTALDLAYIGLPFTRSLLNPSYGAGGGAAGGGMGMGGMGMGGFGGGYGRMGGMGGMGGMQGQGDQGSSGLRRQWVSDEAVLAVQNAQPQQSGGGMGGMGMGGMGMGGMGMGGMGGQQQQPQSTKSVIATYFKSRVFFIIIFTIATIILTSSILTHSGINLAQLLMKLIGKGNTMISNVQVN